jgi:DNA repair exonuclease SbcCD ATPase subunit
VIPQRVKPKGFLCYKEEQVIDFEGNATLWMLSGLNGSGKSAIFDAVTYALFGHHRGGGTHNHELINKDSDGMTVEFDFLLDGKAYRAKRTLKRDTKGGARGTQQMFRYDTARDGTGGWVAIEDTGQKRAFDDWIADNLGLNYDTFTSSVLLLQGKAEKLLDSKPEGRREVLASIVDLERFEHLHQKADDRRKAQEGALKTLKNRLEALPPVLPLEVQEARGRIESAEAARKEARDEVERLQELAHRARSWEELRQRLSEARLRYQRAQDVLGSAQAIEQAVERLRELREVLPRLRDIALYRGQLHEAETRTQEIARRREKAAEQLGQRDHALKQARDKRASLHSLIARDEAEHREVAARLRKSTAQLEKLKEYERQEADLGRLRAELKKLPADPGSQVEVARKLCEELEASGRALAVLARFQSRREELRQAQAAEQKALLTLQAVGERGKALKAEVEGLRPRLEEATQAFHQAGDRASEARTLLQQARDSLTELTELAGSKVCRHCGQTLTRGHLEDEKRRRAAAVSAAEARHREASEALQAARSAEQALREQLARAEKAHQDARVEYQDANNQSKSARAAVERLQGECAHLYSDLPEPFRVRISPSAPADWLATNYPAATDLDALRNQARGLESARKELKAALQVEQGWGKLKAQEAVTLENLNRLLRDLPQDREAVRKEHADLEAQEKTLFKSLDAGRAEVQRAEKEVERLTRGHGQVLIGLGQCDTQLKEQELVQQNAQRNIASQLRQVPPAWTSKAEKAGLKDLHVYQREQEDLEQAGTDERARELHQARVNLDVMRQDQLALEAEQDKFPPEARQEHKAIAARLAEARQVDRSCDEELARAREQLALLESYRKQREQLEQECLTTEAELASQRLLAELLGRDRLQLYLVRQAERQVVDYANAVLDRLSGGQLYLKLSGEANGEGTSAKALELEAYNRGTGEKPINVAFLSGSQKFRVAVSLALGIGQYASRQHRPIESVIIDEGFGCLDSQGRQVMIQELQNLRGQMRCILLVSHQEDFAESFSDGYHFALENGATKVKRFQK